MTSSKSRSVLPLLVFAVLGVLLASWWGGVFDGAAEPRPLGDPATEVGARSGAAGNQPEEPKTTRSEQLAAQSNTPIEAESEESLWTAFGRCVDEAGSPVADVQIEARLGEAADADQDDRVAVRSDETGRFRLECEVDGERDGEIRVEAPGRVPLSGRLRRPLPGETADLGDIVLRGAVPVDGLVVDEAGEPVEGARIMFVQLDPRIDKRFTGVGTDVRVETMLIATSDAQGRFDFDAPAFGGEWFIGAEYTGALVEPRNVQVDPDASRFDLKVVVERPDIANAITGKVVDDLGRPVADTRAVLTGQGFIGRGLSDADGNIVIHRAGPMPRYTGNRIGVDLTHESGLYEPGDDDRYIGLDWGARDVEFRLVRRASRAIRVVDSRGAPVEAFTLHAYAGEPGSYYTRYSRIEMRGTHPGGRCELTGLRQGGQAVVVVPDDPNLGSTEFIAFSVEGITPGPEQLIVVPDRSRCTIRVIDGSGSALAGSTVEILQTLGGVQPGTTTRAIPLSDADRSRSSERVFLVTSGQTDAQGQLELTPPPGSFFLRVRGEGHVDRVQEVVFGAGDNRVDVTVETGASVRGRIGPPAVIERLREITKGYGMFIEIQPPVENAVKIEWELDEDGSFERRGIPVGEYEIRLRLEYESGVYGPADPAYLIASRTLAEGLTEELEFDASDCVPGRVTGRVLVDGEPLAGVHCFLRAVGMGYVGGVRVGTDEDGRFEALVKPGEFEFMATMPAQPGPGWIRMPAHGRTWRVEPDGDTRVDVSIQLRRATFRFVDAEGKPLADTLIDVVASAYGDPTDKRTDANGEVLIDPAPPGEFRVRIGIGKDRKTLGPFSLPKGELVSEITITVE